MKVWVVLPRVDYEGHSPPIGVFTRLEQANEARAKALESDDDLYRPDDVDIYEYELDSVSLEPVEIDTL